MDQNDPTDHALAAIASILDRPAENLSPKTASGPPAIAEEPEPDAAPVEQPAAKAPVTEAVDLDHYVRFGPGPLDALRFRWTARRDDAGHYFVDETIGPNSRPLSLGPMGKDDVIGFIDERARAAQQRFDTLKNEMTIRTHRHDGGES